MHKNEVIASASTVEGLIATQFPDWAEEKLEPFTSSGTDNIMYRLGEDKVIRLPRIPSAALQLPKQYTWLPQLAPQLPLRIPRVLALGEPNADYPFHWLVSDWLEGNDAHQKPPCDMVSSARQLAAFITALQRCPTVLPNHPHTPAPRPDKHNFSRGVALAKRDGMTRVCLEVLHEEIDVPLAYALWDAALAVPVWTAAPVWIHGDLKADNLLVHNGELSAVIDFGGMAVGDPACDMLAAWHIFEAEARQVFRASLEVDDATWLRGMGWALSVAAVALPYYKDSNPTLAAISRFTLEQVLSAYRISLDAAASPL